MLLLEPREAAIFPRHAATEGMHETQAHPTGASLLGWAAAQGRYQQFQDPFRIFHSGQVRFSNAVPLTAGGHPAFRIPGLLVERKHGEAKDIRDGRLVPANAWIGEDAFRREHAGLQSEALQEGFVAADLSLATCDTDSRLRTATRNGRALTSTLFGYGHIEPTTRKDGQPLRYAATIEADEGLADEDWVRLRTAFEYCSPRLGRAGRTGYGGWYECTWRDDETAPDLWPSPRIGADAKAEGTLRVWLLSDLALLDEYGAPCFAPTESALLGLPPGGTLVPRGCAVASRRYSPWNGHLHSRDLERQVMEAGSVLTYHYDGGLPDTAPPIPSTAGLFREQGLGRVWVDPPMLRGAKPVAAAKEQLVTMLPPAADAEDEQGSISPTAEPEQNPLRGWARRLAILADTTGRDKFFQELLDDFDRIRRRCEYVPSPSQWNKAANAACAQADMPGILRALFDDANPACGRLDDGTRERDWLAPIHPPIGEQRIQKIRPWLKFRLEQAGTDGLTATEMKWTLDQLAKYAAEAQRQARETPDA